MVPYQNQFNLINAPEYLPDMDIFNSCVNYDESKILNMKNEDSMEEKVMDQKYLIENHESGSEMYEMYDKWYSCFVCSVSFNSQFALDAHLHDTFHNSNIKHLPQSSIKLHEKYKLIDTGEKLHNFQGSDHKFNYNANFQTHLKSDNNIRTLTCSLCEKTIIGKKNFYIHYLNAHNKKFIRNPQTNQSSSDQSSSSSNSDDDFNEKKKKLNSQKLRKYIEQFGSLVDTRSCGKKKQELENVNLDAEGEKSEKYAVQEAIESKRQDTLKILRNRKQQQTADYNTEEYKELREPLILEKNSTGKFNEAKYIGPLFRKNFQNQAGLIEEAIRPLQFQGRLKPIECTSCGKSFARLPISNEGNILPSKPPCSQCFKMKDESILFQHQDEKHRVLPPYICKECLWVSDTWFKYVQHMKKHLVYAAKCSECVNSYIMNKPANTISFLCHVCEMFFDSDDELMVHVQIHLEN